MRIIGNTIEFCCTKLKNMLIENACRLYMQSGRPGFEGGCAVGYENVEGIKYCPFCGEKFYEKED